MGEAYDIIGDVHGQRGKLVELLRSLGYEFAGERVAGHPEGRRAVFLGDFIDRGPDVRGTLEIVRGMVGSGLASAVMGNHELAALLFDHDPGGKSGLRGQLSVTHRQFEGHDEEWRGCLDWFRSLPLAIDLGGFRAVHALWNDDAVAAVAGLPSPLTDSALETMGDTSTRESRAARTLLEGIRLDLPDGLFAVNARGMPMNWMRAKWWRALDGLRYDDVAFPDLDSAPRDPIILPDPDPAAPEGLYDGYPSSAPPVFIGHFSLPRDSAPRPLAPNVLCLDYGVWKGGPMVAYRWDGELRDDGFVTT